MRPKRVIGHRLYVAFSSRAQETLWYSVMRRYLDIGELSDLETYSYHIYFIHSGVAFMTTAAAFCVPYSTKRRGQYMGMTCKTILIRIGTGYLKINCYEWSVDCGRGDRQGV